MAYFPAFGNLVKTIIIGSNPECIIFVFIKSCVATGSNQVFIERFIADVAEMVWIISEQVNSFLKKSCPEVSIGILKYSMYFYF